MKKKIYWKNWDTLCLSKLDGGLGLRTLNLLTWQCLQNNGEKSLIERILLCIEFYVTNILLILAMREQE